MLSTEPADHQKTTIALELTHYYSTVACTDLIAPTGRECGLKHTRIKATELYYRYI